MTFEEAIEIIEKVDGEFGAFRYIINKLQETYAPKIKMTSEQKDELMQFLDENEEFEDFWYCYGYGRKLYKEFSEEELYKEFTENELMQAWLHPELIEVVE